MCLTHLSEIIAINVPHCKNLQIGAIPESDTGALASYSLSELNLESLNCYNKPMLFVVGQLSARMLLPGNTWLEVWATAKPVPALRQKRLFDETTEAEKALHFLESQSPGL